MLPAGKIGLEAAPSDQSGSADWIDASLQSTSIAPAWVTGTPYIVGDLVTYTDGNEYVCITANSDATWTPANWLGSFAIGAGQANTTAIIAQGATEGSAYLCSQLTIGSNSDWFLPSIGELSRMRMMFLDYGVGGFAYGYGYYYWSSSEGGTDTAWYQYFGNGTQDYGSGKGSSAYVRCARAF